MSYARRFRRQSQRGHVPLVVVTDQDPHDCELCRLQDQDGPLDLADVLAAFARAGARLDDGR